MKTNRIILLGAALMAAACAKEISPENNQNNTDVKLVPVTFNVGGETGEDAESKVVLGGENMKEVHWTQADKIKVFDGVSNELPAFNVISGFGTTSATISGKISETAEAPYFAMYPYQEGATFTAAEVVNGNTNYSCYKGYMTINIPSVQKAVANSVDPDAFIGIGYSDDGKLFSFKNLTAFVKFRLNKEDIDGLETVSLSGNENESGKMQDITGTVYGYFNSDKNPSILYSSQMYQFATLTAPDDGWNSETDYYIAIRPTTFDVGFTITAKYSDGSCRHITENAALKYISRNQALALNEIPKLKNGLPEDLYIAYLHGQNLDEDGLINKSNFTEAVIDNIDKTGKLNFITKDQTNTGNFDNITVVGRYKSQKPVFTKTRMNVSTDGNVIFKNVTLDFSAYTNYAIAPSIQTNITIDNFIFEDCIIRLPKDKPLLYWKNDSYNINVNNAILRNNKISVELSADNNAINLFNFSNEPITPKAVKIDNNLIYATTDYFAQGKLLILGNTVNNNTASISFKNNTLINFGGTSATSAQPLVMIGPGKNQTIDFSNNIIYYNPTKTTTVNVRIFTFNGTLTDEATYQNSTISINNNKFYHPTNIKWTLAGTWPSGVNKPGVDLKSMAESPFATITPSTGTFILKSAYAGCGSSLVPVEDTSSSAE